MPASVCLIPTVLSDGRTEVIPAYVLEAIKECSAFFVEDERTARRFLKLVWKEMVIDNYAWHNIKDISVQTREAFIRLLKEGATIGVISEAGCPGVADPGQHLIAIAQELQVKVRPFVGPNSILLGLMGSGMNGQHFQFHGYLPIDTNERSKVIKSLELHSRQTGCTEIFIETPYRNNQLLEALLKNCQPGTRICVAANLTGEQESIFTLPVKDWKQRSFNYHKQPAIFLLNAKASNE